MIIAGIMDIRDWLEIGIKDGATHMLVVHDEEGVGDYPIYIMPSSDAQKRIDLLDGKNNQKVLEVYNLSMSIEDQLKQFRVWNI